MPSITPGEFATKSCWSQGTEFAVLQEHFIDPGRMLDGSTPNEADPTGEWNAFKKVAGKDRDPLTGNLTTYRVVESPLERAAAPE